MDFYNYEDSEGEIDLIITPVINLSASPVALLSFDIAHARFGGSSNDGLRVLVISDCNTDLNQAIAIYEKSGAALSTTVSTTTSFTPTNASQWRTETINLNAFIGQNNLQLAFIGLNDYGNNLYLDNVSVTTSTIQEIALSEIVTPSPVTCLKTSQPVVRVKNNGTVIINSLTANYTLNGGTQQSVQITGINLGIGQSGNITLPSVSFTKEVNTLTVELKLPNGVADFNPSDNTSTVSIVVNEVTESIPANENFDGNFSDRWTVANTKDGMDFQTTTTNFNTSQYFNAFDNTAIGDEAWLVSPVFDFSTIAVKQMTFNLSYKANPGKNDRLRILVSTDCGYSYSTQLFDKSGFALSNETSTESWTPEQDSDWQNLSVDLSSVAGKKNVRIAFVMTNDNGNNLYLDNIDFFVVTNTFAVYPNPAKRETVYVALNLPEGETAQLEIIDRIGKVVISQTIKNSQNQIHVLSLPGVTSGMYFVRLKTSKQTHTEKLLIID
jgi:hypothetical protein